MLRGPQDRGTWFLVGTLVVLLTVLAALQYHWTGEIGRAEAERERNRLGRAAHRMEREFAREVGQVAFTVRSDVSGRGADPRARLLERVQRWQDSGGAHLVSKLTLVTFVEGGEPMVEVTAPGQTEFVPASLSSELEPLLPMIKELGRGSSLRGAFRPEPVIEHPPTLAVPVVQRVGGPGRPPGSRGFRVDGVVFVTLDEAYLREVLLPELAEIHFGPLDESDYAVAVLRGDGSVVYSSDPALGEDDWKRPDVRHGLDWSDWAGPPRFDRGRGFGPPPAPEPDTAPGADDPGRPGPNPPPEAGAGEGRGEPPLSQGPDVGAPGNGPRWSIVVRHHGGSLAEAVDAARRRSLAVGLGVLTLLGTAAALLAVGGQRARRLAHQQLEFVAGVTHELHTPLAAIRSAGQNLADGVVSDPHQVQRYGDLIEKEGGRLGALVAQVLDFAGIESGSRVYSMEAVRVDGLVHKVTGDLSLVLEQAGMTLETDLEEGLPEIVGDAQALRRALENLLTNAAKFAAEGEWVRVAAASREDGRAVRIRVEDRGPGIPRADQGRVFEPFHRGQNARQSQASGSGLGLSLVRRIVEAHGGRVRLETPAKGGTAVEMELPVGGRPVVRSH